MATSPRDDLSRRGFLGLTAATGVAALTEASTAMPAAASASAINYVVEAEARTGGGSGVVVRAGVGGAVLARQQDPAQIVTKVGDFPVDSASGYQTTVAVGNGLRATGTVTTAAGSRYQFDDVWTVEANSVLLQRTVTVVAAVATLEMGFNSRFAGDAPGPAVRDPAAPRHRLDYRPVP